LLEKKFMIIWASCMIDTITVYFKTVLENQSNKHSQCMFCNQEWRTQYKCFSGEYVMDYSSY